MSRKYVLCLGALLACWSAGAAAAEFDAKAAQALVKKSKCLTCHSLDKKKDGPSFTETAGNYKDKPDAEEKLYTHLTTNPTVEVDGKEEEHDSLKTTKEAEIRNVIQWILSR